MAYTNRTSLVHSQQPTRSILKPAGSWCTISPPSGPSRPAIKIQVPSVAPGTLRAIQLLPSYPLNEPIPASTISLPKMENSEQLEELFFQLASHLKTERLKLEEEARNAPQAGRPTFKPDEFPEFRQILMGPWTPTPHDGTLFPFLGPREATMIRSFIKINPHLSGPSPGKPGHLHWDVTQPPSTAQFIGEDETLSFDQFCDEPLTAPMLTRIEIISPLIPGEWHLYWNVGDALEALFLNLADPIDERYIKKQSEEWQTNLWRSYRDRCPDEALKKKPRMLDLLSGNTMFGGLVYDPGYEEERKISQTRIIHMLITFLQK